MASVQGRTYLCKRLDLDHRLAVVRPANLKYYTRPRDFTDVFVVGGHRAAYPAEVGISLSAHLRWRSIVAVD